MENNKTLDFFKKNATTLIVVVISIFYIFWGSVELVLKDLKWWELICYVATTLLFGVCITSLVGETGFSAGKENKKYKATRSLLIDYCDVAIPYKEEAIEYVGKEIDKEIKEERTEILHRAGILYNEIFDESGKVVVSQAEIKKRGKYTKKQKKSVRQTIRIKKYDFTLFAYSSVKVIGRKREISEQEYRAKNFGKDFITRILLAVISGSIMFMFNGLTWATIIYSAFQIVLWVSSGIMKRTQNYNFIVVSLRDADLDRIGYLKAFLSTKGIEGKVVDGELQIVYNKDSIYTATSYDNE